MHREQLPVAFCANFTGGCTPSDEASQVIMNARLSTISHNSTLVHVDQISSWAAVHAFFATEGRVPAAV